MKDRPTPVMATEKLEKEKKITHMLQFSLIALIALFADQLTKALAFAYLPTTSSYFSVINGWLGFSHVENDAIAFGIGSGKPAFMVVIMIVTAILIVGIPAVAFFLFKGNHPAQVSLAFIEGGAIGNFIDRLFVRNAQGVAVVRDFVDLTRFGFANCNVADFCVTFGAVAFIIILLFIGPQAAFPLKKAWREEAKRTEDAEEETK